MYSHETHEDKRLELGSQLAYTPHLHSNQASHSFCSSLGLFFFFWS